MSEFVDNKDLTRKLNYILKELNMTKKKFLDECHKYNPCLSKPTIINMFKGNNTTTPTLQTLATVIKVCQNSGNENLKRVSFNYLLNDGIYDIEAKNTQLYDELGLNDDAIEALKRFNTYFIPLNKINIINDYIYHIPHKYWNYLDMLKKTYELKKSLQNNDLDTTLKIFDDISFNGYIKQYFSNIFEDLENIINSYQKNKNINQMNIDKALELIPILIEYLKVEITKLNNQLFEDLAVW